MSNGAPFRSRIHLRKKTPALTVEQRSAALLWQPDPTLIAETHVLPSGLCVRCMRISRPCLAGRSLLFFSDTHIRVAGVRGVFPFVQQGGGTEWLTRSFRELFDLIPVPDCIAFGGDLSSEAAWIDRSLDFLRTLPSGPRKIAVCGNWELRRSWLPSDRWRGIFAGTGFHLLVNESAEAGGILFYGMDDAKEGEALSRRANIPQAENVCILSHNPDAAAALLPPEKLGGSPLILCGHTHGGQFRVPGYGALLTSSKFGKHFEYGAFRHSTTDAVMYVTAGIGATWFHARIFCPPEVLLVNFC